MFLIQPFRDFMENIQAFNTYLLASLQIHLGLKLCSIKGLWVVVCCGHFKRHTGNEGAIFFRI
jgi:hypothetical protein